MTLPPENTTGIYKITSPSGRVYIGQAYCIKKRWYQYQRGNVKYQRKLYNSFKKYGFNKHQFRVLTTCSFDELNEYERYYQELYNVIDNGLNCQLVNTNIEKKVISEETKKLLSESHKGQVPWNKGIKMSKEHCLNIREGKRKNPISEESRRKIREANKGRVVSKETRRKISEKTKGKKRSEETKKKMSENMINRKLIGSKNPNYKEIIANSPSGEVFINGIEKLDKEINISKHIIRKILNGSTSEKHAGWTFKYAEQ